MHERPSAIVDNIPTMDEVLQINTTMNHGRWLSITLTGGVGGNLLSLGATAGMTLGERCVGHDQLLINARYVA